MFVLGVMYCGGKRRKAEVAACTTSEVEPRYCYKITVGQLVEDLSAVNFLFMPSGIL